MSLGAGRNYGISQRLTKFALAGLAVASVGALHGCGGEDEDPEAMARTLNQFKKDVVNKNAVRDEDWAKEQKLLVEQNEKLTMEKRERKAAQEAKVENLRKDRRPKVEAEVVEEVVYHQPKKTFISFDITAEQWAEGKPIAQVQKDGTMHVYRRYVEFTVEYTVTKSGKASSVLAHRLLPFNIYETASYKMDADGQEYFMDASYKDGSEDDVWYAFRDIPDNKMNESRNYDNNLLERLMRGEKAKIKENQPGVNTPPTAILSKSKEQGSSEAKIPEDKRSLTQVLQEWYSSRNSVSSTA